MSETMLTGSDSHRHRRPVGASGPRHLSGVCPRRPPRCLLDIDLAVAEKRLQLSAEALRCAAREQ